MYQRFVKFATFLCLLNISKVALAVLAGPTKGDISQNHISIMPPPPLWYNLFLYFCIAISIPLFYRQSDRIIQLIKKHRLFAICLAIFFISCVWAVDPLASLDLSVRMGWAIIFGLFIVSYYSSREIFLLLWMLSAVIIISDWVFIAALPHYAFGVDGAWQGAYGDRNYSTMYADIALAFMLVAIRYLKRLRWPSLVLALAGAVFVIMSHSATGLIVMVAIGAVFILFPLFRLNWRLCVLFGLIGACSVAFVMVMADSVPQLSHFFLILGKRGDLTGRVEIWEAFMVAMQKHMLFGYGPQNLQITTQGQIITGGREVLSPNLLGGNSGAMVPHSLYIALMLKYGIIGTCFFAILAWQALAKAVRQAKAKAAISDWRLLYMIVLLIFGITLTIDYELLLWTIFTIVLVSPYSQDMEQIAKANTC